MRIAVDLEKSELAELLKVTGETKRSAAVKKAVTEFLNMRKAKEFGRLLREGAFDFEFTNEEIERQGF